MKTYTQENIENLVAEFDSSEDRVISLPVHRGKTSAMVDLIINAFKNEDSASTYIFLFPEDPEHFVTKILFDKMGLEYSDDPDVNNEVLLNNIPGEDRGAIVMIFGGDGFMEGFVNTMQTVECDHLFIDNIHLFTAMTDVTLEDLKEMFEDTNIGITYTETAKRERIFIDAAPAVTEMGIIDRNTGYIDKRPIFFDKSTNTLPALDELIGDDYKPEFAVGAIVKRK